MIVILPVLFAFSASAAIPSGRQHISCVEKEKENQYTVEVTFNPSVSLANKWRTGTRGDYIEMYTLGDADNTETTSARIQFTVPGRGEYSGEFAFDEFYSVNEFSKGNEGYGYIFDNKPYRAFHGNDKDNRYDAMVYVPDEVLGQSAEGFPALLTIQPDILDQGYYHIDLVCSSRFRRQGVSRF